jgi:ArsR family transcriptional regulator
VSPSRHGSALLGRCASLSRTGETVESGHKRVLMCLVPSKTTVRVASLLRTLAEPNRLEIVRWLARRPSTVSDLVREFALSQPLVSHHIKRLRDGGFIERGSGPRYRVRSELLRGLSEEMRFIADLVEPEARTRRSTSRG